MTSRLVLASASPFRRALLENAGLHFDVEPAQIDERAVEEPLSDLSPEDVASVLAEAKAQDVSSRNPGAIIIGSDQTLSLAGDILHKAASMDEARRRLLALSGRTHELNSAVTLVKDGETLWRHMSIARMTMRDLDPAFIGIEDAQQERYERALAGARRADERRHRARTRQQVHVGEDRAVWLVGEADLVERDGLA